MELRGKTAFVTGASYGIGRAMALGLARAGCDLIIMARNQKGLEETAERVRKENVKAKTIICDATKWEQVKNLSSQVEKVDILYNGIANWINKPFLDVSGEEIEETIDAVYKSNLLITKTLLNLLISSRGTIINMVSDWGLYEMTDKPALFGSAKVALGSFGDLLREELKDSKVRVVNIYPTEVSSNLDIDDLTQQDKTLRLKDLIEVVLSVFKEHTDTVSVYVSNLNNKLEIKYK